MSQTSIRVDTTQRDALARVAAEHQESQDQALRRLIWEHDCMASLAGVDEVEGLRAEASELAEVDVAVVEV